MSDNLKEWALGFPWWDLTRNITLGMVLTVILMLQLTIMSESMNADEMAELADVLAILGYFIIFLMILPLIQWLIDGLAYYTAKRWVDGGEPA